MSIRRLGLKLGDTNRRTLVGHYSIYIYSALRFSEGYGSEVLGFRVPGDATIAKALSK